MIETRAIDEARKQDINIPNQPFALWGRMIPSYQGGKWGHTVEKLPRRTWARCASRTKTTTSRP